MASGRERSNGEEEEKPSIRNSHEKSDREAPSNPTDSIEEISLIQRINLLRMLIHQRLSLRILQENRKPIIMIPPVRIPSVSKLPVHIAHLLLEARLLPQAQHLGSSLIVAPAEILLPLIVCKPAVLLMHDGLLRLAAGRSVVFDPLDRPRDGFAPPVRVGVEDAEVDVFEAELFVEVAAVGAVVCPVVAFDVKAAFAAPCH